jgi:hypothetical protein
MDGSSRAARLGMMLALGGTVLHFVGTLLAFAWDEDFIGRVVDFTFPTEYDLIQAVTAWLPVLLALVGLVIAWRWKRRRDIGIGIVFCSGLFMLLGRAVITAIVYWGSPWRIGAPVTFVSAAIVIAGAVLLAVGEGSRSHEQARATTL